MLVIGTLETNADVAQRFPVRARRVNRTTLRQTRQGWGMTKGAPLEIRTERLLLRRPRAEDASAIYENYAGDEAVGRYLAWPMHRSIDDTRAFLELSDQQWTEWSTGPYLICLGVDELIIGSTGLILEAPNTGSTGYVIAKKFWGRGYATEAVRAMTRLASMIGCDRVTAYCHPDNLASVRVLKKSGFSEDAVLRNFCEFPNFGDGGQQDAVRYVWPGP